MEVSGVVFQVSSPVAAAAVSSGVRRFSGRVLRLSSVKKSIPSLRFTGVRVQSSLEGGNSTCGFRDDGHVEYYNGTAQKKKEKELKSTKKAMKKKLKLIEGLSKNLSAFSDMGFGLDSDADSSGLTHQVKGKMISEATELLLGQLQQLRVEEMELKKKKKKEEKAKQKATMMMQKRMGKEDSSSSSSSESSDSECDQQVVDMSRLKNETTPLASIGGLEQQQQQQQQQQQMTIDQETHNLSNTDIRVLGNKILGENSSRTNGNLMVSSSRNVCNNTKKIEVCMGGKCKKSGAASLLEEFKKAVGGNEGEVVGCKCMGKCREGPNVRVVDNGEMEMMGRSNPLYIGVGLEDVGLIVSNFIGSNQLPELGLVQPAAAS